MTHAWEDEVLRFIRLEIKDFPRFPESHLHPSCCGKSAALSSPSPEEGPGSRNSVPSVQSMPKLSPFQSMSSSASLVPVPGQHYIATLRPMLGPALGAVFGHAWPPDCVTGKEKECLNKQVGECMLQREAFGKLWLYYLGLRKDQVLLQTNQSLS